jgi:hypothetical protein
MLTGALASPSHLVACDVGGGAFGKCRRALGVLLTQRGPLVAFALERVYPLTKLLTTLLCLLPGSLQANVGICTQADPMTAATKRVSK